MIWSGKELPELSKSFSKWLENTLPQTVKNLAFPGEKWANTPFGKKDHALFSKSLIELSELLTEGRHEIEAQKKRPYLNHAKFLSSYSLYYLPLHAVKFWAILKSQPKELFQPLPKTLRVVDLGSGPGSASIGLIFHCLEYYPELRLEISAVDASQHSLKWMEKILASIPVNFPDQIQFKAIHSTLQNLRAPEADLVLSGNFFNELPHIPEKSFQVTQSLLKGAQFGWIAVEPAIKSSSQKLSELRNAWVDSLGDQGEVLYPCPHTAECPLTSGKNWCHFSPHLPEMPRFWRMMGNELGSVRDWAKWSGLWIKNSKNPIRNDLFQRIVSDAVETQRDGLSTFLACSPNGRVEKIQSRNKAISRGVLKPL